MFSFNGEKLRFNIYFYILGAKKEASPALSDKENKNKDGNKKKNNYKPLFDKVTKKCSNHININAKIACMHNAQFNFTSCKDRAIKVLVVC